MRCIAEHCPELHTLLLDRSEYWTDAVAFIIVDGFPHLRRFRMRGSPMLTHQCLYTLIEVAHRFSVLELEPSYSMSSYALDDLRKRMAPAVPGLPDGRLVALTSMLGIVDDIPAFGSHCGGRLVMLEAGSAGGDPAPAQ